MKAKYLLILLSVFLLSINTLFSQELKFTEDTMSYTYIKNDTLIQEYFTYCPSKSFKLKIEGGTAPYSNVWKTQDAIEHSEDSIMAIPPALTGFSYGLSTVTDANSNEITKYTYIYNDTRVSGLPTHIELKDTIVWTIRRPMLVKIKGPGIYLDTVLNQYYFRPDSAGIGVHTITWSYEGPVVSDPEDTCFAGGGENPEKSFTINVYNELKFNSPGPEQVYVCENQYRLIDASANGGILPYTYSWQGTFESSSSTSPYAEVNEFSTINYCTVTDAIGNTITKEFITVVEPEPIVDILVKSEVCENDPPEIISIMELTSPVDYCFWSGNVTATNHLMAEFDPSTAGVGTHYIDVEVISFLGCTSMAHSQIIVHPKPEPIIDGMADLCENETYAPFTATPQGGIWSSTGIINSTSGEFDPYGSAIGMHTVTYDYTDANGCSETVDKDVEVHPSPQVIIEDMFNNFESCEGEYKELIAVDVMDPFNSPGYMYYWNGTIEPYLDNNFNESVSFSNAPAGTYDVWVDVTNIWGCMESDWKTIKVNPTPVVIINPTIDVCENGSTQQITAIPQGGTWSSTGVIGSTSGEFDPSASTIGTHQITYDYTDANGCSATEEIDINVFEIPTAIIPSIPNPIYSTDAPINLNAEPNHTYTGIGIEYNNNTVYFNPAIAGVGMHTIEIVATNPIGPGCNNVEYVDITVLEAPTSKPLIINGNQTVQRTVCYKADEVLEMKIFGGKAPYTYTWNSYALNHTIINDSVIALNEFVVGTDIVTCKVEDALGAQVTKQFIFTVVAPEAFEMPVIPNPVYLSTATFELVTSTQQGYYGIGIEHVNSQKFFNPSVAGVGVHSIEVYNTNSAVNSCTDTSHFNITVIDPCMVDPGFDIYYHSELGNSYEFHALETGDITYSWSLPDGATYVGMDKRTITHKFSHDVTDEVCLTVIDNMFMGCQKTECVPYTFLSSEPLLSISGKVFNSCCNVITCGKTIAMRQENNKYVPVDTADIQSDGTYIHTNLIKGTYIVLAEPCEIDRFLPTYFYSTLNQEDAPSFYLDDNATSVDINVKEITTAISDIVRNEVTVYPNPMYSQTTVEINNLEVSKLEITNMLGVVVYQQEVSTEIVSLSKEILLPGSYVIVLKNNNNSIVAQKILIVK